MNSKFFNPLMNVLLLVATVLILAGSLFQLQHWPYGVLIQRIGFLSFFLIGSYEISRLRKVVRELTKNITNVR